MTEPSPVPFEPYFSSDAMEALEQDGFTMASALLGNARDVSAEPTRPYEVPLEALLEGTLSESATLPFVIDELPEEAFRTAEFLEEEDPFERFNASLAQGTPNELTPTAPHRSSLPKLAQRRR